MYSWWTSLAALMSIIYFFSVVGAFLVIPFNTVALLDKIMIVKLLFSICVR